VCQVKIGDFTLFGPAVQIYTATHPLNAEGRNRVSATAETLIEQLLMANLQVLQP
jgi:acetyltransferase-like isoleucine patch superfamily enzyme